MTNAAAEPINYSDPEHRFNTNGWTAKPDYWGSYVTQEGIVVHMLRKGCRVRFYDDRGHQYGGEHRNIVPAVAWVYGATEWFDPENVMLSVACRKEVRANSTYRRRNRKAEAGAYDPNAPLGVVPEIA